MAGSQKSSKHPINTRIAASPGRRIVVPDRMIRSAGLASPIINLQSSTSKPSPLTHKKPQSTRRQPITSTKVHTATQKVEHKMQQIRPKARRVEPSTADTMEAFMKRHNRVPKHLARTANRAHLLSQTIQSEQKKPRWHQKLLAGFAS